MGKSLGKTQANKIPRLSIAQLKSAEPKREGTQSKKVNQFRDNCFEMQKLGINIRQIWKAAPSIK